jgi:replicative DNA helicase
VIEIDVDPVTFHDLRRGLGLTLKKHVTVKASDVDEDDREAISFRDMQIRLGYEPKNVDAEAALLGALMIDNRLLDHIGGLQPEHFVVAVHEDIFTAIQERVAKGQVANPVTLRPQFEQHEGLKGAGGAAYLAQLTGSGAAVIGARDFAAQITQLFGLRELRAVLRLAVERAGSGEDVDAHVIAADLEGVMSEKFAAVGRKSTVRIVDAFDDLANETETVMAGGDPAGFLIERFHDWNAVVGRMEPADFILLGARPSIGKTGVGMEVALGAAHAGIGTDFLSLEMDRRKATRRAIASIAYDPPFSPTYTELTSGKLSGAQFREILRARDQVETLPLTISDPDVMAVEDLAPHIRRRQREFQRRETELKLVVVDYLGRLISRRKFNSETELASHVSRSLKQAAKETGVTLIVLSQLSRALEQRDNKRPMLADLRQSGSLEQDADTVVFLYREEYYLERAEPPKDKAEKWQKWADELARVRDVMEIYSSKRREGPLTKRMARFFTQYQAVRDHNDPAVSGAPSFFDDLPEQRG